jgi:hypothetical protein|tara:strand:- start:371 stop:559 length:189 start_codon:yes stop_codon:yes gene_type:complete
MTEVYHLESDRNRNIIVSSHKIDDMRRVRDLLNKIDKTFIKNTKVKPSALNFTIVKTGGSDA